MTPPSELHLEPLAGPALAARLGDLARLRITVFRDYPYLYDGSLSYEETYLARYAAAPGAVIIGAFDGTTLVGASTALPLAEETASIRDPIDRAGFPIAEVFYFGESVLLPAYRGRGVGVGFFHARESWALSFRGIRHTCFCAVIRPPDHPARPADYKPLDGFWHRRGYRPLPGVTCTMAWKECGQAGETTNRLQFWWRTPAPAVLR